MGTTSTSTQTNPNVEPNQDGSQPSLDLVAALERAEQDVANCTRGLEIAKQVADKVSDKHKAVLAKSVKQQDRLEKIKNQLEREKLSLSTKMRNQKDELKKSESRQAAQAARVKELQKRLADKDRQLDSATKRANDLANCGHAQEKTAERRIHDLQQELAN